MAHEFRGRELSFSEWSEKAAWLDGAAWLCARKPRVRDVARRFALAHDPNDYAGIAEDLFAFVRDRIRYVHDPASEEFSDAEQTLGQGYGDCDDKVRLLVALARSLRLEARIRPVMKDADFAHVQAQLRWPGSYRYHGAELAGWVPAEVILAHARLGDQIGDVPDRIYA